MDPAVGVVVHVVPAPAASTMLIAALRIGVRDFLRRPVAVGEYGAMLERAARPTVANAGLGVALRLGFREIYLFGVDMGSKVDGRFHSRGSIYGSGEHADPSIANERLPGNFGGSATSITTLTGHPVLGWSRHMIEAVLAIMREARVYNCSDGARISGTVPRLARTISLSGDIDRTKLRSELEASLYKMSTAEARQRWNQSMRDASPLFARIRALIEAELATETPATEWVHEMFALIRPQDGDDRAVRSFLTGTMMMLMGAATWYDRHAVDPQRQARIRRIAYEEMLASIVGLEAAYAALMTEVERRHTPAAEEAAA